MQRHQGAWSEIPRRVAATVDVVTHRVSSDRFIPPGQEVGLDDPALLEQPNCSICLEDLH